MFTVPGLRAAYTLAEDANEQKIVGRAEDTHAVCGTGAHLDVDRLCAHWQQLGAAPVPGMNAHRQRHEYIDLRHDLLTGIAHMVSMQQHTFNHGPGTLYQFGSTSTSKLSD